MFISNDNVNPSPIAVINQYCSTIEERIGLLQFFGFQKEQGYFCISAAKLSPIMLKWILNQVIERLPQDMRELQNSKDGCLDVMPFANGLTHLIFLRDRSTILLNCWSQVGEGCAKWVDLFMDLFTGEKYVRAMELDEIDHGMLYSFKAFDRLKGVQGICLPIFYSYEKALMISPFLDTSLYDLVEKSKRKLTKKEFFFIALQLLETAEEVYWKRKISIHDFFPGNVLLKLNSKEEIVACQITDFDNWGHEAYKGHETYLLDQLKRLSVYLCNNKCAPDLPWARGIRWLERIYDSGYLEAAISNLKWVQKNCFP